MKIKITKEEILPFLGFFFLTIGNGKYIFQHFGNAFEYLGLIILVIISIYPLDKENKRITIYLKFMFLSLLLSIGSFFQDSSSGARIMILSTSTLIVCFSLLSSNVINSNRRIKNIANAIFFGCSITAIIGVITGTLGLYWNPNLSMVGICFLSGFQVKNYCGAIWLLLFILYNIYFTRNGRSNAKKIKSLLFILFCLIVISGSKGAMLLCILYLFGMNYNKIIRFQKDQRKIALFIILLITIFNGLFFYKQVLPYVNTYAYRMRGLNAVIEYLISDLKNLFLGISRIAYADTGYDYTGNLRNFLGWENSVEMAYVNILVKNGLLGLIGYFFIFRNFYKKASFIQGLDKKIVYVVVTIMLISGLVETYIASIHYILGPTLFCLSNGIINQKRNINK